MRPMPAHPLHGPLLAWFDREARPLPWRGRGASGWRVLVSEVMLQQTPVDRVLPVFHAWVGRWPDPGRLAADPPGEAVRMWGRLGYPRRAVRLHAAATACVQCHDGTVPSGYPDLRALPGVGDYTAAAVASFAFGQRRAVLDTNIRRVLARAVGGTAQPSSAAAGCVPRSAPTSLERARAGSLLPDEPGTAAHWCAAAMELGALVCRARRPACERCPVAELCAWNLAGRPPAATGPSRPAQRYVGTDRQARGNLLAVLRAAPGPVTAQVLARGWDDTVQRGRALQGLLADGLAQAGPDGTWQLPGCQV
jgi:A/G-specific adenine glycosylase